MLAISCQVHLRPLWRARNSTPSPRNPHLYESIRLETRIKIARLTHCFWQPGWTTVFCSCLPFLFGNADDGAWQANDVMCTTGLHSVEWDYDYAGMELEHLEDIPGSGIGSLG